MEIGFIGTGTMGTPMAGNLIRAGHELAVYDLREEASRPLVALGARVGSSPRQLAEASQIVFMSLPGPSEVEEAVLGEDGILAGAAPGLTCVDLSTNSPAMVRSLHARMQEHGVALLDSPVGGNAAAAATREMALLVGGDEDVFLSMKPVLDAIGNDVLYCGPSGAGTVCKLASNLIGLSVVVLLGEAFSLGVKAGVPPRTLFETISKSSGNTAVMQALPGGLFKGDFTPGFMVDLALKDLRLALDLAREFDVPMQLGHLVESSYLEGKARGWGRLTSPAIIQLQEERAGVTIRDE